MLGLSPPKSRKSVSTDRLWTSFDAPHETVVIYRRTKNLRAAQLLLGHTKLESTVRYPGIEVEDALQLGEQTEM